MNYNRIFSIILLIIISILNGLCKIPELRQLTISIFFGLCIVSFNIAFHYLIFNKLPKMNMDIFMIVTLCYSIYRSYNFYIDIQLEYKDYIEYI